jgi:hypothetical protein
VPEDTNPTTHGEFDIAEWATTPALNWHLYECHTNIPCSPADEGHGEQEPATKGAIVGGGTDGGEYDCHDRKAEAVCDEDDVRDGFKTTQPREDTLFRGSTGRTGRA